MAVEVTDNGDTDNGDTVTVTYRDGDGNSASATVIGESATSVKNRRQEIVDAHDLESKATQS
jgi:hypothetical protein